MASVLSADADDSDSAAGVPWGGDWRLTSARPGVATAVAVAATAGVDGAPTGAAVFDATAGRVAADAGGDAVAAACCDAVDVAAEPGDAVAGPQPTGTTLGILGSSSAGLGGLATTVAAATWRASEYMSWAGTPCRTAK
eukprot:jgi/Mesvir1/5324/Mv25552-RA.1